jgi:5'-methylthioadenosine phosphorylase
LKARVGVMGGSGLYALDGLTIDDEVKVDTPYGPTSDAIILGRLGQTRLAFLARHGRHHHLTPSEVPYRANIWALKRLGVEWIVSASAVGSLREDIAPGDMVVIDQYIDRTKGRASSFFGDGVVAHVAFGDPVCSVLRGFVLEASRESGAITHDGGTYVCMEGPAFSTRAESELYRSWRGSVVGMTNLPEAKLAREAEISYATLAMATDYDCWHTGHDDVTAEQVINVLRTNAAVARKILLGVVQRIEGYEGAAPCANVLDAALMTPVLKIPAHRREALTPILARILAAR